MSLPTPEGRQKEVLCLPEEGHYVVLGTAGSGKTTLAIHRAVYLANLVESDQKVMLVTFNKSLVTYLNCIAGDNLYNIDVRHYHRFARGYLGSRGLLGMNDILDSKRNLIGQAVEEISKEIVNESTLARAPEVFYEEICWMQKMGITSLEEYVNAERIGRSGTRITKEKRKYFYIVYERYLEIRERYGYKYDWEDIAQTVKTELERDTDERMYKHIIIDEGQDFSPVMLQSLVKAIPGDGSITFFGDVAQQIYGGRISWRNAGLNVKKSQIWRFDQNYRNSKEIADLAIAISKQPCFTKSVDLVSPKKPKASGPKPAIVEFTNENEELDWVICNAIKLAESSSVAILARTREIVNIIRKRLGFNRVLHQILSRDLKSWDGGRGISVGTFHSAKGLEFETVFVPFCSESKIPDADKIVALEGRDEALSEDAKLLYVAVTRARRGLILTYSGELTEIIPTSSSLYNKTTYNGG